MGRTFQLFHLSLLRREQGDLFQRDLSREDWIRSVFTRPFQFTHRKRDFFWVPKSSDGDSIIAIVERQTSRLQHRPPEQGGDEIRGEVWQGAVVIIDPRPHDSGQRVAFEVDRDIGTPNAVLGSVLWHLNAAPPGPYYVESKPVFDGSTFWTFAREHGGILRRITFGFVVPNMWDTKNELDKELRETGEQTGAQRVQVTLESSDGVKADTPKVREGVDYSEKGGASLSATSINGATFHSSKRIQRTKVETEELRDGDEATLWKRLAGKILGRE